MSSSLIRKCTFKRSLQRSMCSSNPDNKEARTNKVAELETLLEETYLSQLKYARADLENLQKHMQSRIDEGVAREKERMIMQLLPVAEKVDLALEEAKKTRDPILLEGLTLRLAGFLVVVGILSGLTQSSLLSPQRLSEVFLGRKLR